MSKCVECTFLELDHKYNSYTNEYWCDNGYVKEWKKPDCRSCDSFCEAYDRSASEIDNAIRGISDGCFRVTMTCELLGKSPTHDIYLQKFKEYKRNYLMKQEKLRKYLVLYEELGPAIAHKMKSYDHGARASIIARNLYYIYFPEIIKEIDEGNNTEAFRKYVDLVATLTKACEFKIEHKKEEQGPIKTLGSRI